MADFLDGNSFEASCIRQGRKPPVEPVKMECDVNENKRSHRVCELCNRVIIGDREWAGRVLAGGFDTVITAMHREQCEAVSLAGSAWPDDPQHMILGFQGLFTACA